jgi:hypothetical protein
LRFISSGCPLLRATPPDSRKKFVNRRSQLRAEDGHRAFPRCSTGAIVDGLPRTRVKQESERGGNWENGGSAKNRQQFTVELRQALIDHVRSNDAVRDPEDDEGRQC